MVKIYLIRHGESVGNQKKIFQGITDLPLSENGKLQVAALAERMKDIPLDKLYSSPLIRAYQTAEAVNRYHHLEIIVNPIFREISLGEFEGHSFDELEKTHPAELNLWKNELHNFAIKGGESMAEVYDRAKEAILNLVSENEGKTIAVTSHGAFIRSSFCFVSGKGIEEMADVDWQKNATATEITYENGGFTARYFG